MDSRLQGKIEDLETELQSLLYYRRSKLITKSVYDRQKKKLQGQLEKVEDRLADIRAAAKRKATEAAKKAADLAKRTYVLTQEYDKQKFVFDTSKKWGGEYRPVPSVEGSLTYTTTIVRRPGESLPQLQMRANKIGREAVYDMDSDMGDGTGDTILKHTTSGGASLSQGGGGGMGMTRLKPWAYENSGFYSIAEEGKCVPNSLKQIYPKYDYDYIVRGLFPDGDDSIPCLAEWVYNWAVKKDITVIGCDELYNILKGEETGVPIEYYSRNGNHKALYFVQKDNHFYVMNREKALSIVRSRSNSIKAKKEEEKPVERTKIFIEQDLNEIDFPSYKNTHIIVRNVGDVKSYLINYMNKFHAVPKLQFDVRGQNTIYLKSFVFGDNNKLSYEPHFNTVKKLSEKLNIPINSMREISQEYALQTIGIMPKSFMNNTVMNLFQKWKQRQHFAHLVKPSEWENVEGVEQTWDMNKQYTNILRNNPNKWLLFDMFSLPTEYSGTISDAYYFIETRNTMPCKGNGWYSRIIAEYLIENQIDHTITYEIKASRTLVKDFFQKFVDKVMQDAPDSFKYITNTFCGALNTHDKKSVAIQATVDKSLVIQKCLSKGAVMCKFEIGKENIYCAATIKEDLLFENNMPMYSQILDTAAVQLATAIKHLEAKGCVIRSYNTDSITFKHPETLEIDLSKEVLGGWKSEEPKPHEHEVLPKIDRNIFVSEPYEFKQDKTESEEFDVEKIIEFLKTNSCFVSAPAGFGKSWIAERVIEAEGVDKCCVLGYTNIAANNIGGSTFHKTFKISIDDYKGSYSIKELMKDKNLLVIDEISQVPSKMYKIIEEVRKLEKRVLIFGDLKQILPIGENGDGLSMLSILCDNRITLTTYRRGDAQLLNALTKVRDRERIPFIPGEKGSLHFCFTKQRRDLINERETMKVTSGYFTLPNSSKCGANKLKRIFPGMPLRSTITKADDSMLNGERWIIESVNYEEVRLKSQIRDVSLIIPYDKIQENFVPGYAMTIHSSQGLTIKEPYTVHIENSSAFEIDDVWRMVYTAVSRACKKEQVGVVFHE